GTQQINVIGGDVFKNVTIAGGNITLNGKVLIQNQFNIQAIIQVASVDTLQLDSAATILNASATSYVQGALGRKARDISYPTDSLFFPVCDNSGNYRPLTLTNLGEGNSKAIIRVSTLSNLPAGATAPQGMFLYKSRYWKLSISSGKSYGAGSPVAVYFNPTEIGNAPSSSVTLVASLTTNSGSFGSVIGNTASTLGSITSTEPVPFSNQAQPGGLVFIAMAGTLPICSFNYTKTSDTVVCAGSFNGILKVNYPA